MYILKDFFYRFVLRFPSLFPDRIYLKLLYPYKMRGEKLNLDAPLKFNEKLNWMKINYRDPRFTKLADKYEVKQIVKDIIGNVYVVPCYGIYNCFDDISFDDLPQQFVVKTTHDSSGVFIVRDKNTFDITSLKKRLNMLLNKNHYWLYREWPYKNIKPRILIEQLLDDKTGRELRDYKFWCFNGVPKIMYITNKGKTIEENFYDMDFRPVNINHGFPRTVPEYSKPKEFEEMKELASKLSKGLPFVRIDFFDVNNRVYFGEYTFYDWGGFQPFEDPFWENTLGSWINLNQI